MMHTLIGCWTNTLSIGNLMVATLMVLFFLAAALMLGARRSPRWTQLVKVPVVLVVWWWFVCQGGRSGYHTVHGGEPFGVTLATSLLVFFPGLALILGTTIIVDRLRTRRERQP